MLQSKDENTKWSRIKGIIYEYKHYAWASMYGVCQIWFNYCERTIEPKYYMVSRLDYHIPFIKWFVIPYLFWFVYMGVIFWYVGKESKKEFYKLCIYMFGGMCVCYTIYMVFPNGQNLRPVIVENDILSRMISNIYMTDTPTNVCPSIHVYNSIAVHMALRRCGMLDDKPGIKLISFICMVLICASTMFIKQHSIKDVMWGTILAAVMYFLVYNMPRFVQRHILVTNQEEVSAKSNI